MTDSTLRALERSTNPRDEHKLVRELQRAGKDRDPLVLLYHARAYVGDEAAREITGHDAHVRGEMAWAAVCYAAPTLVYGYTQRDGNIVFKDPWPWDRKWDKRHTRDPRDAATQTRGDRIRELSKAGALIAAELDRLIRLQDAVNDGR